MINFLSLFSGIGAPDKAAKVVSQTQLYKQAGNSICVPVLEMIIKEIARWHFEE